MTANNSADEGLSKTPAGNGGEAPAVLDAGQPQSQTVAALTEQAGRDASTVALRQAELSAAQHADGVKRVAGKAALAVVIVAGLIAAFALINWAIVNALSPSLPGWQAPLVVAAAWITLSTALLAILFPQQARQLAQRAQPSGHTGLAETIRQRQQRLEQSEQKLRETLEQLSSAIANAAEERIASAILPLAGGMVEVGEEMVEASDEIIEAADEITDALEDRIPGGIIINRAVDIALVPGRYGIRIAKGALTRSKPGE